MTHRKHFKKHDGNRDIRKPGKRSIIFERVMCVLCLPGLACTGLLGFLRPQATKGFITEFVTLSSFLHLRFILR